MPDAIQNIAIVDRGLPHPFFLGGLGKYFAKITQPSSIQYRFAY